jgi:hypothetical protein
VSENEKMVKNGPLFGKTRSFGPKIGSAEPSSGSAEPSGGSGEPFRGSAGPSSGSAEPFDDAVEPFHGTVEPLHDAGPEWKNGPFWHGEGDFAPNRAGFDSENALPPATTVWGVPCVMLPGFGSHNVGIIFNI